MHEEQDLHALAKKAHAAYNEGLVPDAQEPDWDDLPVSLQLAWMGAADSLVSLAPAAVQSQCPACGAPSEVNGFVCVDCYYSEQRTGELSTDYVKGFSDGQASLAKPQPADRALANAAEQFIAWREDGVPEHPMLDYFAEIFGEALAAKPQPVGGALTDDQWLELAERHAVRDWEDAKRDGYLNSVKALCLDFATLSAPVAQPSAKAEREACARLCDEFGDDYMVQARGGDNSGASDHKACAAAEIADAIRARAPAASEVPTAPIERLREVTAGLRVPLYKPHDANAEDDTYDHE